MEIRIWKANLETPKIYNNLRDVLKSSSGVLVLEFLDDSQMIIEKKDYYFFSVWVD